MNARLEDILVIEGVEDASNEEYYKAMQRQINEGVIWKMQGSMGRAAMDALKSGSCMCAKAPCKDYWGNTVPSRDMLQPGSFGTYEFVVERMGQEWADAMAAIE
jgi:hypothetical protein